VIDGDTIVCNINDWPEIIGKEISIRMKDCNAPEIRTSDKAEKALGLKAKKDLEKAVSNASEIALRNMGRGKYFRITADIYADNKKLTCSGETNITTSFTCGGKTKCSQMTSCAEAYYYLNKCGLTRLDRDKDGIPCESICN